MEKHTLSHDTARRDVYEAYRRGSLDDDQASARLLAIQVDERQRRRAPGRPALRNEGSSPRPFAR